MFDEVSLNLFLRCFRVMLCGNQHCIDPLYLVILILYRHLCFAVRSQIFERTVLTNVGQSLCQLMCVSNRCRHQLRCFIAGITEHQTLVACADGINRCLIL